MAPRFEPAPPVRPAASWRVTSVEVLPEARLRVRFIDGTTGEVHMQALLRAPATAGTVFEPLRDPGFLARAAVVSGAVQWPNPRWTPQNRPFVDGSKPAITRGRDQ
jgi:hypothetical protein